MWPEIRNAKIENRYEINLSGKEISKRIEKDGLDLSVFELVNLNYLQITETTLTRIPDAIGKLVNLQKLVLHTNKLEEINENVSQLTKLKCLDLSVNCIKSIPESFSNLLLLERLTINLNELDTFPTFFKNKNLHSLNLSHNKLKSFPDICSKELRNLAELNLQNNEIEEIPKNINYLPSLKIFDISSNNIKVIPTELSDLMKLKDINLKGNPIKDRDLLKLIDRGKTKHILDYIRQNCSKLGTSPQNTTSTKDKNYKNHANDAERKSDSADEDEGEENRKESVSDNEESEHEYPDDEAESKNKYVVTMGPPSDEMFKVSVLKNVTNVRRHIIACVVNNVSFTEETLKMFINLKKKLRNDICDKRRIAFIGTHDFNKIPPGNLIYTTLAPDNLMIKPLNQSKPVTGKALLSKRFSDAETLRKIKKRSTYSNSHKYLYSLKRQSLYPCLLNKNKEVISFPPITTSDISKLDVSSTKIFVEVTSSKDILVCESILKLFLLEMCVFFNRLVEVQQVAILEPKT